MLAFCADVRPGAKSAVQLTGNGLLGVERGSVHGEKLTHNQSFLPGCSCCRCSALRGRIRPSATGQPAALFAPPPPSAAAHTCPPPLQQNSLPLFPAPLLASLRACANPQPKSPATGHMIGKMDSINILPSHISRTSSRAVTQSEQCHHIHHYTLTNSPKPLESRHCLAAVASPRTRFWVRSELHESEGGCMCTCQVGVVVPDDVIRQRAHHLALQAAA